MSVLVEAISVIVRVETLKTKYPGGPVRYWLDCPNQTFCTDRILTRVGFMAACDVKVWIDRLQELGFTAVDENNAFVDFAVIDQQDGPTRDCDWLLWGTHKAGYGLTWLKGSDPSECRFPRNWKLESSLSKSCKRTLEPDLERWMKRAHWGQDGMLHRKDPVDDQVDHLAMIWGPDLPSQAN